MARDTEQRLIDAAPYFAPAEAALQLFLCRWSRRAPIGVSLPADASAGEQRALRVALAAWEGAGLGLRFTELSSRPAQIEIDFWQAERDPFTVSGAGNTVADCRLTGGLSRESASEPGAPAVAAELSYASIYLLREGVNTVGESVPYTEAQLAGAALHELGHALGFPGHVARGDSIMVRQLEVIVRHGAAVLDGHHFDDANLSALYALPSGSVVGRRAVDAGRLSVLWRIGERALEEGWQGPYVRVGERTAQLHWRGPEGQLAVLLERDWVGALRRPESFDLLPNRVAVSLLVGTGLDRN
ncbi:MAG: matrixin family metalloprotease [Deltaproteobacteria bacterium]|nr:matrixin family metalloprotease [Deltaproteobacteria bacterium]MBW2417689.1 matrixin family metalloprotease [Deltaproteobacteria bacterium]